MRRLKDVDILYLPPKAPGKTAVTYFPFVYIEASIDFNDIRTGYKGAEKLARALKFYQKHAVPGWAEEIIYDADIDRIQETAPRSARLRPLPEFVDVEFIENVKKRYVEYLTRTWKKLFYRNSELNIYSGANETMEDFLARCREQFLYQMSEALNQLRIIFNRMQEQLKEKYLGIEEAELTDSEPLKPETSDRDIYSRYAERIAELFLNASSSAVDAEACVPRMEKNSELEERLIALASEARQKITLLRELYEKKAELIDEYILRPNLKNIQCGRSGILWAPMKAE